MDAVLLVLLLAAVGLAADKKKNPEPLPPDATAKVAPSDADYLIGIDDVLAITVWREADLSRAVPVRQDGKISFPLVGQIQAAGLTPLQVQEKLTTLLSDFLKAPEVSVVVQDAKSQRFNVIGEVARPGVYPLAKPMTVLDALALAGGFRDFAKTNKIFVMRVNPDGSRQKIPFDYKKAVLGKRSGNPGIELQARDTVVVP